MKNFLRAVTGFPFFVFVCCCAFTISRFVDGSWPNGLAWLCISMIWCYHTVVRFRWHKELSQKDEKIKLLEKKVKTNQEIWVSRNGTPKT